MLCLCCSLQNGSIPLHHACYSEEPNEQAVQLLLDAGSDVNAQDAQGCTPVIAAAKKNQAGVIALLRARGADLSIKNTVGGITMRRTRFRC
jgi:ankyrin repeat protein